MSVDSNYEEKIFKISFPVTSELATYVPREEGSDDKHEFLRTRAAVSLREAFGVNVATLEEQHLNGELSLYVSINSKQVAIDEFREKVKELKIENIEETEYRGRH